MLFWLCFTAAPQLPHDYLGGLGPGFTWTSFERMTSRIPMWSRHEPFAWLPGARCSFVSFNRKSVCLELNCTLNMSFSQQLEASTNRYAKKLITRYKIYSDNLHNSRCPPIHVYNIQQHTCT